MNDLYQKFFKPDSALRYPDMDNLFYQTRENLKTSPDSQTILKRLHTDNNIRTLYDQFFVQFLNEHNFILQEIARIGRNNLDKSDFLESYKLNMNIFKSSVLQITQILLSEIQQKFIKGLEKAFGTINDLSDLDQYKDTNADSFSAHTKTKYFQVFNIKQPSEQSLMKTQVHNKSKGPTLYQSNHKDLTKDSKTIETTIQYLQRNLNKQYEPSTSGILQLQISSSSSNIILLKHKDSLSSIQPLKQKEASPLKESVDIYGIKNEDSGFSLKDYIEQRLRQSQSLNMQSINGQQEQSKLSVNKPGVKKTESRAEQKSIYSEQKSIYSISEKKSPYSTFSKTKRVGPFDNVQLKSSQQVGFEKLNQPKKIR